MTKTPPRVKADPAGESNSLVLQIEELHNALSDERQEAQLLRETHRLVVAELERQIAVDLALREELSAAQKQLADLRLFEAVQEALERQLEEQRNSQVLREEILGAFLLRDTARQETAATATTARLAEAEQALAQKSEELSILQRKLQVLEHEQHATRQKSQEQVEEIARLQEEISKIYDSNSWRLTEPMRSVRTKLRGSDS